MLSGLAGGLVRIGWPLLPEHFVAPVALHSALMVCGFFGLGIALERAAALKQPIAFAAPALAATARARWRCSPGWRASSGCWPRWRWWPVYAEVMRRAPELHTAVEAAGALAWAGGTLWWLLRPFSVVVAWWAAFLVLTIFGERRELARFVPLSEKSPARLHRHGCRAGGCARRAGRAVARASDRRRPVVAVDVAVLRLAAALRPRLPAQVHRFGWALHTARSLRLGYTWLMLAGLWGVVNALRGMPLDSPGPLHMLLLGFVFDGVRPRAHHAAGAAAHADLAARPFAFVPVGLMTLGVTLRALGDAIGSGGVRAGAGALQAAAILTFAFTMIRHLRR